MQLYVAANTGRRFKEIKSTMGMVKANDLQEIQNVRRWYDRISDHFIRRYEGIEGEYWKAIEENRILRLVPPFTGIALDAGCGNGRFAFALATTAHTVIGLDISNRLLSNAAAKKKEKHTPHTHFVNGDSVALPFADHRFDLVVSAGMMEYMQDPTPFLREIKRVVTPKGTLVFTFHYHTKGIGEVARKIIKALPAGLSTNKNPYARTTDTKRNWTKVWHRPGSITAIVAEAGFSLVKMETCANLLTAFLFKKCNLRNLAARLDELESAMPFFPKITAVGVAVCKPLSPSV